MWDAGWGKRETKIYAWVLVTRWVVILKNAEVLVMGVCICTIHLSLGSLESTYMLP